MPPAAPRVDPRLLDAIDALYRERVPIAEIARRVGATADRLGITRPSYQRVRVLVHDRRRQPIGPDATEVLLDVAFRARPFGDIGQLTVPSAERRLRPGQRPRR